MVRVEPVAGVRHLVDAVPFGEHEVGEEGVERGQEGGLRVLYRCVKGIWLQRGRRDLQGDRGDGRRVRNGPRHEVQLHLVNGLAQTCQEKFRCET